ncbi:PASTA domain-containing protein [Pseudarthrobacter sp. P1]|uniref:PASTA domain-containing protein n=1 Tax=Pseudarthrobacter sp. P1 TaxID=3418418 RepID=UPI003CE9101D
MKKLLAPLAIAALLLTACGGGVATAPSSGTPTDASSQTATQKPDPQMPDVVGMNSGKAVNLLSTIGINTEFKGPDGKAFSTPSAANTTVKDASVSAGTTVKRGQRVTITLNASEAELAAQAAATALASQMATRYQFTCTKTNSIYSDKSAFKTTDYRAIWASPDFAAFTQCNVTLGGKSSSDRPALIGDEQIIVDKVASNGGDVSIPSGALIDVLKACALPPDIGYDTSKGPGNNRVEALTISALDKCGDAPFAAELSRIASGQPPARMKDGTYVVGTAIQAGTYQVQVPAGANGVHDCYWERTTTQGGTIANDFISFAPQGPVVTIFEGEGFVSTRCGTWSRIG